MKFYWHVMTMYTHYFHVCGQSPITNQVWVYAHLFMWQMFILVLRKSTITQNAYKVLNGKVQNPEGPWILKRYQMDWVLLPGSRVSLHWSFVYFPNFPNMVPYPSQMVSNQPNQANQAEKVLQFYQDLSTLLKVLFKVLQNIKL